MVEIIIAIWIALFGGNLEEGYIPRQYCAKDRTLFCCADMPIKVKLLHNGIGYQARITYFHSNKFAMPTFCKINWEETRGIGDVHQERIR